jgi:glycosyltransferase involved in cell wall biosynthesis
MKLLFVTAKAPFGQSEAFVINELAEFGKTNTVVIVPMRPEKGAMFSDAEALMGSTIARPLFCSSYLGSILRIVSRKPLLSARVFSTLMASGSARKIAKNMAILPKSFWVAELIEKHGVEHIHAYWASTSATAAFLASILSGVPWSFTCYRWDITENNLLKQKVRDAIFARVADDHGLAEIHSILNGHDLGKALTVRSGVLIPEHVASLAVCGSSLRIAVPAAFVEKKGHIYLLEAFAKLIPSGVSFVCDFIGDGPLRAEITAAVSRLNLESHVSICGMLDHVELNARYVRGEYDLVILPSVVASDMEREGIPVSLIEAMAAGLPVISTRTGGIPELLAPDCGILVDQRNADQLAAAISELAADREKLIDMAKRGRERAIQQYDVRRIVDVLLRRIANANS